MGCEAGMDNLLDRMLLDESAEPTDLPLSLLQSITNNFSNEQRIGNGGFAVVYKGVLNNGEVVAVKKLSQEVVIDEKNFNREVTSLIRVKHKNIVRFLGYCAATQGKVESHEGNLIVADIRQRLLCFEFLPKGSLEGYITDASQGLEWRMRYKIIKGICEGLHHLHQKNIVHLDLKPANVLLNYNMVAKIADFGLARRFDVKQTRAITSKLYGTLGYMAPEFISSGVITFKSDIYSLGVIITEMLTGQKEYSAIEDVLESWSSRFQTPQRDTWLELVRICAEIATECIDRNPVNRPDTQHILETLDNTEHTYGFIEADYLCTLSETHASSSVSKFVDEMMLMHDYRAPSPLRRIISVPTGLIGETNTKIRSLGYSETESSNLLDIHPLEVRFPFEPNKRIKCPVTMGNMTYNNVFVCITPTCLNKLPYIYPSPSYFRMEPHSIYAVTMIMNKQQQQPRLGGRDMFEVLMIVMGSEDDKLVEYLKSTSNRKLDSNLLERINQSGGELHRAVLTAVICEPANQTHQFIPATSEFGDISSIDEHPTETWFGAFIHPIL